MGKAKAILKGAAITLLGLIAIVWVLSKLAASNTKVAEFMQKIPLFNKVV